MRIVLLSVFAVSVASAPAQMLFSTFGPGDSYIENVGRSFTGSQNSISPIHSDLGWQFAPTAGGIVREIKVGVRYWEGTNRARMHLHADSAGFLGAELGSWEFGNMPLVNVIPSPPVAVNTGASNLMLTAGTRYWLVLSPYDETLYAAWMDNNQGMTGRMAWSNGVNNYGYLNNMPYSAFSLSSVPEPATLAVLLPGLVWCARRRRQSR